MLKRSFRYISYQSVTSNKISQENISYEERYDEEYNPLKYPFSYFFCVPWLSIQFHLGAAVPIHPIFDSSKDHLHENSLRTHPTTENTAKGNREECNKNNSNYHGDNEQMKILWPKRKSKYIETAFKHIE